METNRKVDELGRVVLPREMREQLNIQATDSVKIQLVDNKIIITKE